MLLNEIWAPTAAKNGILPQGAEVALHLAAGRVLLAGSCFLRSRPQKVPEPQRQSRRQTLLPARYMMCVRGIILQVVTGAAVIRHLLSAATTGPNTMVRKVTVSIDEHNDSKLSSSA